MLPAEIQLSYTLLAEGCKTGPVEDFLQDDYSWGLVVKGLIHMDKYDRQYENATRARQYWHISIFWLSKKK